MGLLGANVDYFAGKAAASRNRRFQKKMSNTAYQRAVADLQKAGLSKLLAYSQGGASTPGGAVAQTGQFSGAIGETIKSVGTSSRIGNELKQQEETIRQTQATTAAEWARRDAQLGLSMQHKWQARHLELGVTAARNKEQLEDIGGWQMHALERGAGTASKLLGLRRGFKPFKRDKHGKRDYSINSGKSKKYSYETEQIRQGINYSQ